MRKVLSVFIAVCLVLLLCMGIFVSMPSASADTSGDYQYTVSGGNATITRYTGGGGAVVIPSDLGITSIGDYAFGGCSNLTSITIPDSVTSISDSAFWDCTGLTGVTLPSSISSIAGDAFFGCASLTSINVAAGNKNFCSQDGIIYSLDKETIVAYPNGKSDKTFTIPDSVTSIGDAAFADCTNLTNITIPDSVSNIGKRAFVNCESLTSAVIPTGVTSIIDGMFAYCYSLTSVSIPNGVTTIGSDVFKDCGDLTTVILPNSLKTIGFGAFFWSGITSVNIPEGVVTIEDSAFDECGLKEIVTIPSTVTSIGSRAFYDDEITGFSVASGNLTFSSQDGVLFNKSKSQLIEYPVGKAQTSYIIPSGVTEIGGAAFLDCANLKSVTISGSVKSIDDAAFNGCINLTSVIIPDSVTSIGDGAFDGCMALTSVTIGSGVTTIGDSAFDSCTGLTTVTIPNNVTTIGTSAFFNCSALTSVTIPNSVTSIGSQAFAHCSKLTSFTVDAGNSSYSSGTDGVLFNKAMTSLVAYPGGKQGGYVIPSSVTSFGTYAFGYCTALTSVTIPNSVTSIGGQAFSGCTKLSAAYFLGNAPKMGTYGFESCAPGFTVHYVSGTTGWTNPRYGYPTTTVENATKKQTVLILHIGKSTFTMNGSPKTLDSPPVVKNGRTLVPIRTIIDALGGTVGWEAPSKKATVTLGKKAIALCIGKSAATVNGASTLIDSTDAKVVPEIINGRTMLPLRFVSENLGTTVGWDQNTQTITITYTP